MRSTELIAWLERTIHTEGQIARCWADHGEIPIAAHWTRMAQMHNEVVNHIRSHSAFISEILGDDNGTGLISIDRIREIARRRGLI